MPAQTAASNGLWTGCFWAIQISIHIGRGRRPGCGLGCGLCDARGTPATGGEPHLMSVCTKIDQGSIAFMLHRTRPAMSELFSGDAHPVNILALFRSTQMKLLLWEISHHPYIKHMPDSLGSRLVPQPWIGLRLLLFWFSFFVFSFYYSSCFKMVRNMMQC